MSSATAPSTSGFSPGVAVIFVIIGFTVILVGGIFYLWGFPMIGEAIVLVGVFLFVVTFICWVAARRNKTR